MSVLQFAIRNELDLQYDRPLQAYAYGCSDSSVAEACGATPEQVSKIRSTEYGPDKVLPPVPVLAPIKPRKIQETRKIRSRSKTQPDGRKGVLVRMSAADWKVLKRLALDDETTLQDLMERAIYAYVEQRVRDAEMVEP
jgi:hypothetical protein